MEGNEEELLKEEGYNQLGAGFLEEVYQEALELELVARGIPFTSKPRLEVVFKEQLLKKPYEADVLVHSEIVVELKAVRAIAPEHEAQLLNELEATRKRVGYLINFGAASRLQWSRCVL